MVEVPENLRLTAADNPEVEQWVAGLPGVVDELVARWGLRLGEPYRPGGSASWVAPAGDGRVLKVGWLHDEALHEADGLRAWDGRGTVRLLADDRFGETCALLLEACEPGTTLRTALPPAEQDEIVAGILPRLWIEPALGHPFRTLGQMCEMWARDFDPMGTPDAGLARTGLETWLELPATADRSVLLCTDLHPDNVLAAQREPWLVVDPKPYLGDPAYEPTQHMFNFRDRLFADPGAFADRMAGLLDLDAQRVRQWLFARCVLEADEWAPLWDVARRLAP
ncbi:aminoglycoside phosphotransferase family protein [Actinoplanes sp. NPDC051633]|uniref:aminoglycoside phosphotransferase family protein n=1 Tax=Actinoplanes sp. NPDC051633 TaxID=3155670 RepID=UPI0034142135